MQNVHCGMGCVARGAVLLEPHVVRVHIIQFRPKEVGYHRPVALSIDGYGRPSFVLEKVRTDDAAGPKSTPNSDFLGMHCHLVDLVWVVLTPNAAILLVHIPVHPEMSLVAEDDFSAKMGVCFQLLQSPVSERPTLSVVVYLELLGQLDFVRVQTQIQMQNSAS